MSAATLAPPGPAVVPAANGHLLPAGPPEVLPAEELWRFSVDDYHRMLEVGILSEGAPVELLNGLLVQKMPISPAHRRTTGFVYDALQAALPADWHVQKADPVTLLPGSEPEPDVAVVRGRRRDFDDTRHPGPADLALVVEVSYSSYARDRGEKWAIYARDGIPTYWIVNLEVSPPQLEVYSVPMNGEYTQTATLTAADRAEVVLDGVTVGTVAVAELLP